MNIQPPPPPQINALVLALDRGLIVSGLLDCRLIKGGGGGGGNLGIVKVRLRLNIYMHCYSFISARLHGFNIDKRKTMSISRKRSTEDIITYSMNRTNLRNVKTAKGLGMGSLHVSNDLNCGLNIYLILHRKRIKFLV